MKNNNNLARARKLKNDEFYTRYEDIEKEVLHYTNFFKDKIVYCNCDRFHGGVYRSAFVDYFKNNFEKLGLQQLIASFYNPNGNGMVMYYDGKEESIYNLKGNGSFDSSECLVLMDECDVVVTNPPFSLFTHLLDILINLDKKFLVIGNVNAITDKKIFENIEKGKIWLGTNHVYNFLTPYTSITDEKLQFFENGKIYQNFGNIIWYTNIESDVEKPFIELTCKYNTEDYPTYENYNGIECGRVKNIPYDYEGHMGVPISFLEKHNPKQFKIIGMDKYVDGNTTPFHRFMLGGKEIYARIVIKRIKNE